VWVDSLAEHRYTDTDTSRHIGVSSVRVRVHTRLNTKGRHREVFDTGRGRTNTSASTTRRGGVGERTTGGRGERRGHKRPLYPSKYKYLYVCVNYLSQDPPPTLHSYIYIERERERGGGERDRDLFFTSNFGVNGRAKDDAFLKRKDLRRDIGREWARGGRGERTGEMRRGVRVRGSPSSKRKDLDLIAD